MLLPPCLLYKVVIWGDYNISIPSVWFHVSPFCLQTFWRLGGTQRTGGGCEGKFGTLWTPESRRHARGPPGWGRVIITVVYHFETFDERCRNRDVTNVSPWRASDNDEKHGWSQAASRKGRRSRSRLELPSTRKYIKHYSIGLNYSTPRKSVLVIFFCISLD